MQSGGLGQVGWDRWAGSGGLGQVGWDRWAGAGGLGQVPLVRPLHILKYTVYHNMDMSHNNYV